MIKRHASDLISDTATEYTFRMHEKIFPVMLEHLGEKTSHNMGSQVSKSIQTFTYSALKEPLDKEKTMEYLGHARDCGVGNFMYATYIGQEFSVVIDNKEINLVGGHNPAFKHAAVWIKSFYAALITRASNARAQLCLTPNSVFQNANITANDFDLALINVYKGLFDSSAKMGELLSATLDASDPEKLEVARQDYIYDITSPVLVLIHAILTKNEEEFNTKLQQALESHKKFWAGKHKDESEGWISLPLLAACSLAVDNTDFNIIPKSEYIPEWIYRKEF